MTTESYVFPASFAQQRLWFLDQLDPGQSVYNLQFAVRLETKLNLRALEESLTEIVRRHESLRTTFGTVDGQPVQIIAEKSEVRLSVIDLSERSSEEQEAEVRRLAEAESERPFDFANGALLRLTLLKLA